ncbi:hypothetical protein DF118_12770 [Burkholderia stagnalis]|nr:hypothetical protein DF149_14995 [Burkholderia stagnalis]RQQ32413.1 hypothetical protein DF163_10595 [Burkholderia stagnalis]RQQ51507.1 hypothetical protein DF162_09430 [Burkholderia stagnalis]RQY02775.1 hypothetical protein DF119_04285 [Burkholderia stagnalis]RQY12972.1 hypothetical protein DF118_12770 [Burkholderia stagnalis]
MDQYKNLNGDSGVIAYEISDDAIKVEFKDKSLYLYNYSVPGRHHVDSMKKHAIAGRGLNGYINSDVRKQYAARLR